VRERTAFAEAFRQRPLCVFHAAACSFSRQKRGNRGCTRPFDGPGVLSVSLPEEHKTHADVHMCRCSTQRNRRHTCRPPCPAMTHLGVSTFDTSSMLAAIMAPSTGMCLVWVMRHKWLGWLQNRYSCAVSSTLKNPIAKFHTYLIMSLTRTYVQCL
jgi:hypothetical protein